MSGFTAELLIQGFPLIRVFVTVALLENRKKGIIFAQVHSPFRRKEPDDCYTLDGFNPSNYRKPDGEVASKVLTVITETVRATRQGVTEIPD